MKVPINRSVNLFHKNLKKNSNNKDKKVKLITENSIKIDNNEIKARNNNLNYLKLKNFLDENENDNDNRLSSNKKYNKNILKINISKSIYNPKEYYSPKIKPKVNLFENVKNKQRKNSFTLDCKEVLDKNEKKYFKYRKKECKSSTFDAFKKRYLLYKENKITKKKEIQKKRTFMKDNIYIKSIKDLGYKTFDIRKNNILNYFKITQENNNNQRNINEYKEKFLIKTPKKEIMNNNIIQKRNIYLYTEKNSNILYKDKSNKYKKIKTINPSNLNIPQENQKKKVSSNLLLDLPNINEINNLGSQKNFSFKLEKKKRQTNPLKSIFNKSEKITKKELPKKTTTINIYNNKINNINNIILNDKNVKKHIKKDDESQFSKSSNNINSFNINNIQSKDSNKEKISSSKEGLNLKLLSSNETNNNGNNKNKINKFNLNEKNQKIILKENKNKVWMNYTKKFFNQFQKLRKKGENINEMEKNIREKILNANSIYDASIKKNLKKIKKETTLGLFQELSKKISYDIEKGEKNYKDKDYIKLDENFIINEKNEYTKKVEKKTVKTIKKLNKFHYVTKNKLIRVYEKNISHYTKINNNESKYFFFKYMFNNYFEYISYIIYGKNFHKESKTYNLLKIYNINKNKNNFSNSVSSNLSIRKHNYFHTKFLQYLLMEKDKIQKYVLNDKYIDKTIKQIKTLLERAKKEINDKKIGNININFIVNNNDNEGNNGIKNNLSNEKNNALKVSFLDLKKTEYSDTDKYDSKSGYDTRGIFPGKIIFNYKSKNNNNDSGNKGDNNNNLISTKKNLLFKKKTFNNEMFNTNFLNSLNNNSGKNLNKLSNNSIDIEKKFDLSIINKYKIEQKYIQNFTKNKDYFFKRNKKTKNKKKQEIIKQKKELNFLKGNYMFKNMIDYRTDEIKTKMKKNIQSPIEMLFYHIKEHDFDEFCELFERKQIDLNARNQDKDSFLIYAVKCKAINFVLYLLKRGINVNLENKFGNTALHYAFMDQNYELADILLQHEADEFKMNIFGKTPWQCLGEKN